MFQRPSFLRLLSFNPLVFSNFITFYHCHPVIPKFLIKSKYFSSFSPSPSPLNLPSCPFMKLSLYYHQYYPSCPPISIYTSLPVLLFQSILPFLSSYFNLYFPSCPPILIYISLPVLLFQFILPFRSSYFNLYFPSGPPISIYTSLPVLLFQSILPFLSFYFNLYFPSCPLYIHIYYTLRLSPLLCILYKHLISLPINIYTSLKLVSLLPLALNSI